MEIRLEQLQQHLSGSLAPIFVVYGDEPLLQQEALDLIRDTAKQQGYLERKLFHVDHYFDWDVLISESQSMSLFAEQKIIELRIASGKPGIKGSKALVEWCDSLPEDHILIIAIDSLDKSGKSSKWYKKIIDSGLAVQIFPVKSTELPRWIRQRLNQFNMSIDEDALHILCHHVEGNLLAVHQEIEKLKLSVDNDNQQRLHITTEMIQQRISDNARFTIYQLIDMVLLGKSEEANRILHALQMEGAQPLSVIAPLTIEIQRLLSLAHIYRQNNGRVDSQTFMKNNIWKSRQPIIIAALRRLSYQRLVMIHRQAKTLDNGAKGLLKIDLWLEMSVLIGMLSGQSVRDKVTNSLGLSRYYE